MKKQEGHNFFLRPIALPSFSLTDTMKLILLSSLIGLCCGFTPVSHQYSQTSFLCSTDSSDEETAVTEPETTYTILLREDPKADYQPWEVNAFGQTSAASNVAVVIGWVPDGNKPCFGLPGALAPTGYFLTPSDSANLVSLSMMSKDTEKLKSNMVVWPWLPPSDILPVKPSRAPSPLRDPRMINCSKCLYQPFSSFLSELLPLSSSMPQLDGLNPATKLGPALSGLSVAHIIRAMLALTCST